MGKLFECFEAVSELKNRVEGGDGCDDYLESDLIQGRGTSRGRKKGS